MRDILKIVEQTLYKHKLAERGDKVLVALSGGSDSVFLLYAMKLLGDKIGFSVSAAHLNHDIRECADDEELFAREFCKEHGVEFFSKKVNVPELASKRGISSETAGRAARYEFFDELRAKYGFSKIATAHHKDDNAETILMHFLRGSGANGLKGIEYIRDELIIRPLLAVSKHEICGECERLGLEYVTDSSNFEPIYTRNKIRLELIPELKKYNSSFTETITSNATLFAEDEAFINEYTERIFNESYDGGFPKKVFDTLPRAAARRIIILMYAEKTGERQLLSRKYTDAALELVSGKELSLPKNVKLCLSGGKYEIVENTCGGEFSYVAEPNKPVYIAQTDEVWKITNADAYDKNVFSAEENCKFEIRSRKKGDRFYPQGMDGSKSVSNLFTDKKVPKHKRNSIPILTADGAVVNIGGKYKDRRFYKEKNNGILYKLEIKHGSDDF